MKNKFINIVLFLIMVILIIAIVIFSLIIYNNLTDSDDIKVSEFSYSINTPISNERENSVYKNTITNEQQGNISVEEIENNNIVIEKYFYQQLNETQKQIYDGLQDNKDNMKNGTYKIQYGGIFTDILSQEDGNEKLGFDYQAAVESFLYDNPDVFYIDANKLFLSVETSKSIFKTSYDVYVGPAENDTYYAEGFESEMQVNSAISKIEGIKNSVISRLTGDKYRDVLKIHDLLVNNIQYDSEYNSIGTYSIYGALIDKKCVCEGYAKALKYLLNAANIPCELAQGTATNSSGKTENHAWNFVYLDEKWYYIDSTWDDPVIVGNGTVAKSVQYKYFLKGSKTFDKDHVLSYQFSEGGKVYRYPTAQEYDYK